MQHLRLSSISLDLLDDVHGGQQKESGNVGITVPTPKGNLQVGLQAERTRSNYAKCVDGVMAMKGSTAADLRATCGLPPTAKE